MLGKALYKYLLCMYDWEYKHIYSDYKNINDNVKV